MIALCLFGIFTFRCKYPPFHFPALLLLLGDFLQTPIIVPRRGVHFDGFHTRLAISRSRDNYFFIIRGLKGRDDCSQEAPFFPGYGGKGQITNPAGAIFPGECHGGRGAVSPLAELSPFQADTLAPLPLTEPPRSPPPPSGRYTSTITAKFESEAPSARSIAARVVIICRLTTAFDETLFRKLHTTRSS